MLQSAGAATSFLQAHAFCTSRQDTIFDSAAPPACTTLMFRRSARYRPAAAMLSYCR